MRIVLKLCMIVALFLCTMGGYAQSVGDRLFAQGQKLQMVQTGQSRDSGVFGCRCAPDASFLQRLRFHADTRCGYSDHAV